MGGVCCPWRRRSSELFNALSEVPEPRTPRAALEQIRRACAVLEHSGLAQQASSILFDLRDSVSRLDRFVPDVSGALPSRSNGLFLPWPRLLPEEQEDWFARCPEGGTMLRTQVAVAALGASPEEWVMGRLSISDIGLLFDGGAGLLPEFQGDDMLHTGLLKWRDVAEIAIKATHPPGSFLPPQAAGHRDPRVGPKELVLTLRPGVAKFGTLHLQLSIAKECEWLEMAWRLHRNQPSRSLSRGTTDLEFHSFHSTTAGSAQYQ